MSTPECPQEIDVAAYALGTLEAAQRAAYAEHLAACGHCQAALESVAGLPGLLARVPADDLPGAGPPRVDEGMFTRLLTRAAAERQARRRRWAISAAAVLVLVAGAGAGWVIETGRAQPPQVVAGASGGIRVRAELRPSSTGTAVRIELSGVRPEERCRLVAIGDDGRREIAASWEATYAGKAAIDGSTAISPEHLTWLRVETDDSALLVRLKVPQ